MAGRPSCRSLPRLRLVQRPVDRGDEVLHVGGVLAERVAAPDVVEPAVAGVLYLGVEGGVDEELAGSPGSTPRSAAGRPELSQAATQARNAPLNCRLRTARGSDCYTRELDRRAFLNCRHDNCDLLRQGASSSYDHLKLPPGRYSLRVLVRNARTDAHACGPWLWRCPLARRPDCWLRRRRSPRRFDCCLRRPDRRRGFLAVAGVFSMDAILSGF